MLLLVSYNGRMKVTDNRVSKRAGFYLSREEKIFMKQREKE
jgi:hypothetical protein